MGMSASQARLLTLTSRMNDIELRSQQIANTKIRLADESEQVANKYTAALNASKFTFTDYSTGQAKTIPMTFNNMNSLGSGYRLVATNGKTIVSKSQNNSYKMAMKDYRTPHFGSWSDNSDSVHFRNAQAVYGLNEKFGVSSFKDAYKKLGLDENTSGGWTPLIERGLVSQNEVSLFDNQFIKFFADTSGDTYNNGNSMQDDGVIYIDDATANDPNWLYDAIESGQFKIEQKTAEGWKETSTSSNTQIAIQSDDTNLAKAEAEYNADTAKINTKEKKLDQQMKEMDTEHSAISTEYDSVKSLISDNISKSFQLFS